MIRTVKLFGSVPLTVPTVCGTLHGTGGTQYRGLAWSGPEYTDKRVRRGRPLPRFSQDGHYKYTYQCPDKPPHTAPHCGNYSNTQSKSVSVDRNVAYSLKPTNQSVMTQRNEKLKEDAIYEPSVKSLRFIDSSFHNPFLDVAFTRHIAQGLPERARYTIDHALEIVKLMQMKQLKTNPDTLTSAPAVVEQAMLNVKPAVVVRFKQVSMAGHWKPCPVPVTDTEAIYDAMKNVRAASQPKKHRCTAVSWRLGRVWLECYSNRGRVMNQLKENYKLAYENRFLYRQFGVFTKRKPDTSSRYPHKQRPTKILPLPHDEYSRMPGSLFSHEANEGLDEEDRKIV